MVQKSYGKMRGTRRKLKSKKKLSINRYLTEFKKDDIVHISIVPSSKFQHPKFNGRTGKIIEKRGNAYVIKVKDGNAYKTIFLKPEHLTLQKPSKKAAPKKIETKKEKVKKNGSDK